MKKHAFVYFSFLLVFLILVPSALADWINLTGAQSAPNIAEIYVEDEGDRKFSFEVGFRYFIK